LQDITYEKDIFINPLSRSICYASSIPG